MTKLAPIWFLITLLVTSCVRQCGSTSENREPGTAAPKLHLFIWGDYVSPEILENFRSQTGIEVVESNFSSNEELLAKLQAGAEGYDLIIPSDYMVSVMSQLDLLAPIDLSAIPNAANISKDLLNKDFDPQNRWSLPYSWAVTGIIYNKTKLKSPVTTYKDLLSREDLRQRVSILDDTREAMASVLRSSGQSVNSTDDNILAAAKDGLLKAKGQIREFNSSPASLLIQGDLLAAQMYSNEALRLMAKNSAFDFVLPGDGFTMAIDNMAIPKTSNRKQEAHALMNFLLREDINLRFSQELLTAPVIRGVTEKLPPAIRDYVAIGQLPAIQAKAEMIRDLGNTTAKYDRIWTEIKAASM